MHSIWPSPLLARVSLDGVHSRKVLYGHNECVAIHTRVDGPRWDDSDSKHRSKVTRRLNGMFHLRVGLDKAARVDRKFSESPVGSSWLRMGAEVVTCQPSDETLMTFMLSNGAVDTEHQWLIHEAALA